MTYTVFDRAQLLVLLKDFYELTGLRTVVFDAWGMDVLSYPQSLPQFCRLIRSTAKGEAGCRLCDQNACRRAKMQKKTMIYACHAGLIEAITPIFVEDTLAGYLLLSHIVQGADEAAEWSAAAQKCQAYDVPLQALHQAFLSLPRTPYHILKSASDLLSLAAKALYLERLAQLVPGSVQDKLNLFFAQHLKEPLTSAQICEALGISRTSLYHLSKEAYGCSAFEHLTDLRMQRAMQLLVSTALSTAQIAQECGFQDYNYFFRVFRKKTGFSPKTYRRQFTGDAAQA